MLCIWWYHPSGGGGVSAGCTVQPLGFIVSLSSYLVYIYKLRGWRDTCRNIASNMNHHFFLNEISEGFTLIQKILSYSTYTWFSHSYWKKIVPILNSDMHYCNEKMQWNGKKKTCIISWVKISGEESLRFKC